jgi:hypothetical protein
MTPQHDMVHFDWLANQAGTELPPEAGPATGLKIFLGNRKSVSGHAYPQTRFLIGMPVAGAPGMPDQIGRNGGSVRIGKIANARSRTRQKRFGN